MIAPLCAWACLLAFYLIMAGQLSLDEVGAGAVCAAAGVLWWSITRRASARTFSFDFESCTATGRACRNLPHGTFAVAAALLRTIRDGKGGAVATGLFAHGQKVDPADSGRRAVGVIAASLAPDSFVLRTPSARDEIVVHTFPPGEPPKNPRWPI